MRNILLKINLLLFLTVIIYGVNLGVSNARVIVHEKEKFYSVGGKTGAQIVRNLMKKGTRVSKSRHAIATTKIKFDIENIKGMASKRNCKVGTIDVIVSLVYTYPKWRGYNRAGPKARKSWDKFMREVKKHERKHGRIAVDTARKVERGFKRGRGKVKNKCGDLKKSIIRNVGPLVARHHKRQMQFDKREHSKYSRVTRSIVALIKSK